MPFMIGDDAMIAQNDSTAYENNALLFFFIIAFIACQIRIQMSRPASDFPANPLHIALVISSLYGGGAERIILTLAQGMIERGHRVDLVLFRFKIL